MILTILPNENFECTSLFHSSCPTQPHIISFVLTYCSSSYSMATSHAIFWGSFVMQTNKYESARISL